MRPTLLNPHRNYIGWEHLATGRELYSLIPVTGGMRMFPRPRTEVLTLLWRRIEEEGCPHSKTGYSYCPITWEGNQE